MGPPYKCPNCGKIFYQKDYAALIVLILSCLGFFSIGFVLGSGLFSH